MRKTLAALAAIAALSGCASKEFPRSPPLPSPSPAVTQPTRQKVNDYLPGTTIDAITHSQVPYSIETVTLDMSDRSSRTPVLETYISQPNTHAQPNERGVRWTPYKEATLFHDTEGRTTSIESAISYIPTKVIIKSTKAEASEITFKPLGPYSSRTPPLRKISPSGLEMGVKTQDDSEFNLPVIQVQEEGQTKRFYVARQYDAKGELETVFIVPVEDTQIGVRQGDRAITLRNPGNIYELKEVKDYSTRTPAPVKSTTPEVEAIK